MNQKKIIVRLFGGLGNQMFQYAFGRRIAIESGSELKLDIISGFRGDFYKRYYSLDNFFIKENFADKDDLPKFRIRHSESNKFHGKIIRFINKHVPFGRNYEIYEKTLNYDKRIVKPYTKAYFIGYWQDEDYFKPIEEIIRKEFIIKHIIQGENLKLAEEINSCQSVGIHLRRLHGTSNGHVLYSHKNKYGDLSLDYYSKAIEFIGRNFENIKLFIFSDSPDWAQNNFQTKLPIRFICHNNDSKNYEDMRLLSLCKHQVIANSSFSWWAAWLNSNKNKMVVAPKSWFITGKNKNLSIIPKDWVEL